MLTKPPLLDSLTYRLASTSKSQWVAILCACLALGHLGLEGWRTWRGIPIHYVPPGGAGISLPGVIPDSAATDVASRCLVARYTFMPMTIKTLHRDFLLCLHPGLHADFRAKAEKEAMMVKEHQMSGQLAITSATVTQRTTQGITVTLEGLRAVWVGSMEVREEAVKATAVVVPWIAQGHPRGLVLSDLRVTPVLSPHGR